MALTKYSNWPARTGWLSDIFDERLFDLGVPRSQSIPAVNIKEMDSSYEIELAAPGLTKKDFEITVNNGYMTVSAEKREEKEQKEDNYTRREFSYASFSRSFNLPPNVNEEDVKAKYEDGILRLSVAKKNEASSRPRKAIEVK